MSSKSCIAPLIALTLCAACSVIVQPGGDRVRCEVRGGIDPCPAGQRCLDGICTTFPDAGTECAEQETGCNDRDDDCDGTTDEGSDLDDDGFEWCASDPGLRDCRDDDPAIHPAGPDTPAPPDLPCDGADNDCSGSEQLCPESPVREFCHPEGDCRPADCSFITMCDAGEFCDLSAMPPRCETATVDCTAMGCADMPGTICDPVSLMCIQPRGAGEPCNVDEQCADGLHCFDSIALELRSEDIGGASRVCSRACCTDDQCPSGSVCWASGSGARGCVPSALLARGPSGAPADEACGRHGDCGGGACTVRSSPAYDDAARRAFTCGSPPGTSSGSCEVSSDCRSGVCVPYCGGFFCEYFCADPCGANSDCGVEDYCGYVRLGSGDVVQACVLRDGFGDGSQGSPCGDASDCRGLACLPGASGNYCADACCSDADCGSPAYACRPRRFDGFWAMLCEQR